MASSRQLETSSTYKSAPPPPTYDPLMGLFGGAPPSAPTIEPATAALASLIEPASTRVGAKLMRRMGWRDGQGVGPRVTFEQRKKQAAELGLKLDAEEDEEEGAGEASKHYFAPLDRPLKLLEAVGISSDRGWGLGYKPGPNMEKALGVGPVTGEGVAIQTIGDDDDDVYGDSMSMGSLAGGDKKRYGVIELGDEDDDYRMAGSGSHRRSKASFYLFDKTRKNLADFLLRSLPLAPHLLLNRSTMALEYCLASSCIRRRLQERQRALLY
jgi:G patch domain-containing protein 1